MKNKEAFTWLIKYVYPVVELFKIAGDIKDFELWLKKEHTRELDNTLFPGYKFFHECAFSLILTYLHGDNSLQIEGDILINSVGREAFPIFKLPNTSEKTIFLKNISSHYKSIRQCKSIKSFPLDCQNFYSYVIAPLDKLYEDNVKIRTNIKLSKDQIYTYVLMESLYLWFNQIGNNGPYAYRGLLMNKYFIPEKKLNSAFEGYKYTLQYLWYKVLGEHSYRNSCLTQLHETTGWKGYDYERELTKKEKKNWLAHINMPYDISQQKSLDAFFERIRDNFMHPLEKKYKIDILKIGGNYEVSIENYSKDIFRNLFNLSLAPEESPTLDEELDMTLCWVPAEIIEPDFHNSIPTFITLLHGAVSLLNKKHKEFKSVVVSKFTHPLEKPGENDYSYGIIVDTMASVGHYNSEWLIYYNCCSDTSGYSKGEYQEAERIIKKYVDDGKVICREFTIGHKEFKKYISKYIREQARKDIQPFTESDTQERMDRIEEGKRHKNIIKDSQGLLLELLSRHIIPKEDRYSKYKNIEWNINTAVGQLDIVLTNDKEVLIIECKLNPNTLDINKEVNKISKKLEAKFGSMERRAFEFWFWHKPTYKTDKILKGNNASYICLCEKGQFIPLSLKRIFNFKTNFL